MASQTSSDNRIWIFGYGSLCWNQGFSWQESRIGYVKGYSRKFWQASVTHRGTRNRGIVWGRAFQLISTTEDFQYLEKRECSNGGYNTEVVTFYPVGGNPVTVITFIANEDNSLWLGDAPLPVISRQIAISRGLAGYNAEYLLKLATYFRTNIPQDTDEELFQLEELVLEQIKRENMCLKKVMEGCVAGVELEDRISAIAVDQPSTSSSEFTDRLPIKKLRCMNI